jgi:hypothetical protein
MFDRVKPFGVSPKLTGKIDSYVGNTGLDYGRTGVLKRFGATQKVQAPSVDTQH